MKNQLVCITTVPLSILQTSLDQFRIFKTGSVLLILGSIWDQFCRFAYLIRLGDHFCGRTGWQKCLHVSRGLLRNETEVKWHSVGSTMTSIVGDVTQPYS